MKVFIGLGNFEEKYQGTRHNVGRDFLLWFANRNNFSDFEFDKYSNIKKAYGIWNGQEIEIVLPETFMNVSGESIKKYLDSRQLTADSRQLFAFHDDIDSNFGEVKIKQGESGSGGHNGIESMFKHLKMRDFNRVKFGIIPKKLFGGFKKPSREKVSNFVLSKFGSGEQKQMESIFEKAENLLK
jgi:PTH1 family peptidyl-tRNA hydrolase